MKKLFSILSAIVLASAALQAQTSIKVQAPNVVAVDEQFNISFIIEGETSPSDFSWSEGENFQLVWGPQKGTSTSISIVNGKRTRSSQSTYTYVLIPRKAGTFTIPEATATVKGQKISSSPASIEVVVGTASRQSGSGSSSSGGNSGSGSGSSASSTGEISSDDLFLRLSLSRSEVVVGEPVTATLKLYQRVNIAGFEDFRLPAFDGFWGQEVLAPTNIEFKRETYNGAIYDAAVLRSYVLIPQQTGDITIDPAELVCLVNVRAPSSRSNSIFDSFFQDDYRTIRKRISSESRRVRVSSLPSGAPATFGGGVGSFTMNAVLSKDSLRTHDAASLVVTVSGKGNVSLLEAPKVSFPPDFEVYDVKVSDNTDKSSGRTTGSKTFEYPFIPRSHGSFTIPAIEYSYFDINTGKYATLREGPFTVEVARGNETEARDGGRLVQGSNRKDVRDLGSDIRFISSKLPSLSRQGSFFVFSGTFWLLLILLLACAAGLYFVMRRSIERRADVAGSRNRAATRMASKRLSAAEGYLKSDLYTAFYEELHKALLGFVSDKFNIDGAGLSRENISASLASAGVGPGLADDYCSLLDACEYARYSPDAGHQAMDDHYSEAVRIISQIDSTMKKKNPSAGTIAALAALLMLAPSLAHGAQAYPDSLWNAGVSAYADGDWNAAAGAWESLEALGLESPELYYNMGNAAFKSSDYARAVLYYERALKLDPSFSDARYNLDFVNGMLQDRIESVPEFFLRTWVRRLRHAMSSDAWTWMFMIFLALALAGLVLFLLSRSTGRKRLGFYTGLAALLLAVLSLSFSASLRSEYNRADGAVVTVPVANVKSSPGTGSSTDLFILHEGAKVRLLDEVGDWFNISLADGRQGWIRSSDLAVI